MCTKFLGATGNKCKAELNTGELVTILFKNKLVLRSTTAFCLPQCCTDVEFYNLKVSVRLVFES